MKLSSSSSSWPTTRETTRKAKVLQKGDDNDDDDYDHDHDHDHDDHDDAHGTGSSEVLTTTAWWKS